MGGAYLAAQKILGDMLIRFGAGLVILRSPAAICVATSISIHRLGESDATSPLKRFLMQKQVANSRAKGIQKLSRLADCHYCVFRGSIAYKGGMQND
jgi:hypothetical protein